LEPKVKVQLKIRRPVADVFDAVVDGEKLSGYFLESSSGPMQTGATVRWRFAEVPEAFDVSVREVVRGERVVFEWPAAGGYDTRVEIVFSGAGTDDTMVQISETGWHTDPESIAASYDNAGGWMHMLCCLKAYLEYGINLRAGGAF
jgi:uncharacterized protein YndB with AHSA1/START domain